jgi:hypothetical protein
LCRGKSKPVGNAKLQREEQAGETQLLERDSHARTHGAALAVTALRGATTSATTERRNT